MCRWPKVLVAQGALRLSTGNLLLWGEQTSDENGQAGWAMEVNTSAQEVYRLTQSHESDDFTISVIGASESSRGVLLLTKDSQSLDSYFYRIDTAGKPRASNGYQIKNRRAESVSSLCLSLVIVIITWGLV